MMHKRIKTSLEENEPPIRENKRDHENHLNDESPTMVEA
jgi:hypothetical protein